MKFCFCNYRTKISWHKDTHKGVDDLDFLFSLTWTPLSDWTSGLQALHPTSVITHLSSYCCNKVKTYALSIYMQMQTRPRVTAYKQDPCIASVKAYVCSRVGAWTFVSILFCSFAEMKNADNENRGSYLGIEINPVFPKEPHIS